MKIALRIALLAVLAGAGFWLWTVWFPSPQMIVLKKISSLAATASLNAGDGNITRAAKVSNFIGYFSTDAEIVCDVPELGAHTLSGRDEIRQMAAGVFTQMTSLKVQFLDAVAHVGADKESARVSCTARVSANDSKDFGVQELNFQFKKIDGDWLITRAETVKTLQ